ncbi:Hypothetical protein MVR_LOCUS86 [uncultured virus]|nr:Hypothetical protein MVR_LOCUS86 [uncultured virus]
MTLYLVSFNILLENPIASQDHHDNKSHNSKSQNNNDSQDIKIKGIVIYQHLEYVTLKHKLVKTWIKSNRSAKDNLGKIGDEDIQIYFSLEALTEYGTIEINDTPIHLKRKRQEIIKGIANQTAQDMIELTNSNALMKPIENTTAQYDHLMQLKPTITKTLSKQFEDWSLRFIMPIDKSPEANPINASMYPATLADTRIMMWDLMTYIYEHSSETDAVTNLIKGLIEAHKQRLLMMKAKPSVVQGSEALALPLEHKLVKMFAHNN